MAAICITAGMFASAGSQMSHVTQQQQSVSVTYGNCAQGRVAQQPVAVTYSVFLLSAVSFRLLDPG